MKSNKIHNYQNTVKCAYYKFTTKTIPLLEIDNYIISSFEKKNTTRFRFIRVSSNF